jgi:phosphatidylglycerol---prolipoprotein diacylglyceryl transferase
MLCGVHSKVTQGTPVDRVCFHIGSRAIYWYGVMMASAFLAAMVHWTWLGRRTKRDTTYAADLAFWVMLGGILGARLFYVLANPAIFRADPWAIPRIDQGGLIYYGGFLGGTLAFLIFARVRRANLLDLWDFGITALPLGHAFGRIGCFLNDCCFGRNVSPRWSFLAAGLDRYPVQIYEAVFNLAVYGFLTWFYLNRRRGRNGTVLALYLLTYPIGRFLLEFLRGDERLRWGALSVAQCISLALLAGGVLLWLLVSRRHDHALGTT